MAKNAVPVRMCSGCMTRRKKEELLRVARDCSGRVFVDLSGKFNGRGAYVCPNEMCIAKAQKRNWFSRSLKVGVSPEIYDELKTLADGK